MQTTAVKLPQIHKLLEISAADFDLQGFFDDH